MKRIISVLLVFVFVVLFPVSAFAASPPQELAPEGQDTPAISRQWVYFSRELTMQYFDYNASVPQTKILTMFVGRDSANGKTVYATGSLSLTGIAYGFPSADKKTATYEGIITATVIGSLIAP